MRNSDSSKKEISENYHNNCIDCHQESIKKNEKSGPVICAECHRKEPLNKSVRKEFGFDNSLHYVHSKANNKKCESCHHDYNKNEKKLFYNKGEEGSCRYCHEKEKVDNRISMKSASHLACIDCHTKTTAKGKDSGPVNCAGCHLESSQKNIKSVKNPPRMKMKQPDISLLARDIKDKKPVVMGVPFNHKNHENYKDNCRSCHHKALKSCNQCHTPDGKKEGNYITLEMSMHKSNSNESCLSCHNKEVEKKECAGCHSLIESSLSTNNCIKCHMVKPVKDKLKNNILARDKFKSLNSSNNKMSINEIPETIVIKKYVDKFNEVKFPHRKIISTMTKNIENSKLAQFYHNNELTICQSCHHNSPQSKNPPGCGSCHSLKTFDSKDTKPGIIGAYHRQCMGCHKEMEIVKATGCTDCHSERKNK